MSQVEDLKDLFDGTPLAVERVSAIWPGLTIIEKAILLPSLLEKPGAINFNSHRNRLLDMALADENAYIRSLAARHVYQPREGAEPDEEARHLKILADASPLVRFVRKEYESMKWLNYKPEAFWAADQSWRLAAVTGIEHSGEEFSRLLVYATENLIPEAKVSEQEMVDVTLQYLTWETVANRLKKTEDYAVSFSDGTADYYAGKSLSALWEIIPKVPRQVAFVLLKHLPEAGGLSGGVDGSVLDALDDYQKRVLLYRKDFGLFGWRAEIFEKATEKDTRLAALSHPHFHLEDSVISALVFKSGESLEEGLRKFDELGDLADGYYGATMAQSSAISKLINAAPEEVTAARSFSEHYGHLICEQRVKTLERNRLEAEFRELQLLEMVWGFVPFNEGINDRCPDPLRAHLLPGDPWGSYLRLKKAMSDSGNYTAEGRALKAAIQEYQPYTDFGLPIPTDLCSKPGDLAEEEETQGDSIMRALSLQIQAMEVSIGRTRSLLWGVIVVLGLVLVFRR